MKLLTTYATTTLGWTTCLSEPLLRCFLHLLDMLSQPVVPTCNSSCLHKSHALLRWYQRATYDLPLYCVQPGYLHEQLPAEAPQQGEAWENIMVDVNKCIVPGACLLIVCLQSCVIVHHKSCNCTLM